jgi:hypothetical protein
VKNIVGRSREKPVVRGAVALSGHGMGRLAAGAADFEFHLPRNKRLM